MSRLVAFLTVEIALRDAVNSSCRLHRDISLGNILLVREGEGQAIRTGYLIDWDAIGPILESGKCEEVGCIVSYTQLYHDHCM